jgi:hypothetical protein
MMPLSANVNSQQKEQAAQNDCAMGDELLEELMLLF